jgi:hypothetical protein
MRLGGRWLGDMRDATGLARGWPGDRRERLGWPAWREFAGQREKHRTVAGVETQMRELI